MKIQLDTNAKTIKLEESVNIGELQELLEKFLPNGQWKEFKLETSVIHNWSNPIVIDRYVNRPLYPWWEANQITYRHDTNLNDGIYCLSINN